jgi:hypothetical protein
VIWTDGERLMIVKADDCRSPLSEAAGHFFTTIGAAADAHAPHTHETRIKASFTIWNKDAKE